MGNYKRLSVMGNAFIPNTRGGGWAVWGNGWLLVYFGGGRPSQKRGLLAKAVRVADSLLENPNKRKRVLLESAVKPQPTQEESAT